jgi:hypothetical protein
MKGVGMNYVRPERVAFGKSPMSCVVVQTGQVLHHVSVMIILDPIPGALNSIPAMK